MKTLIKNLAEGIAIGFAVVLLTGAVPADAQDRQERDDRAERTERADRTARRSVRPERPATPYSNRAVQREREALRIQRRIDRERKPKCFRCPPD